RKQEEAKKQENKSHVLNAFEKRVAELVNVERAKAGLSPLQIDTELSKVARIKSEDMLKNNYFDHNSPVYNSPFDMMTRFGISYSAAGENIAKRQQTPEEVMDAWMHSSGHRANILNGDFTYIGVGYVEQEHIWTQHFIKK
ncbi:CAP domain-containing protein, partial [Bacillus pseudomycoides]|uniref:CAP domain-containing protein n=1 Tax=Bacillus pseudomycoides TaxID=64104 RepID=UPI002FFF57FE